MADSAATEQLRNGASGALVSVKMLGPFIQAAQAVGARVDIGLAAVGLSVSDLENPDLRVSHSISEQMLRRAIAQTGERDLGLLAAETLVPADLDVVEYGARAQPTLRSAFEHYMRFYALLHDGLREELQVTPDRAVFRVSFGELETNDATYEFTLAVLLIAARRITGMANLAPLEVHFTHARPSTTATHQRIFRAPVLFGQSQCALIFQRSVLDAPTIANDPGLAVILERHAVFALEKLDRSTSLAERVRDLVRNDLASKQLNAERLARRLGMSSRTLHRRLGSAGSSYRSIVDDVRREIALHCLRDPKASIREVGQLLGFTTGPAFHRAFRRWTGTTVAASRSEILKAR